MTERQWATFERQCEYAVVRAAAGSPEDMRRLVDITAWLVRQFPTVADHLRTPQPVRGGRTAPSYTWDEIAQALGVTRQAAQQRFGGRG